MSQSNLLETLKSKSRTLAGVFSTTPDPARVAAKNAFKSVEHDLNRVEERIVRAFQSEAEVLTQIASYLLNLGGKRIRPVMTLLSGKLFGQSPASAQLVDVAAGIELIHMATLLHDDIIDASPTRRKKTSAYREFGLPQSLLAGDFLLVRAFGICAHLDTFVIERTERACVELTEGEVLEGTLSAETPYSFAQYLDVISKKTASLFELSTAVGAHLAGATPDSVSRIGAFGRTAGIAFQMIDDVLDIVSTEEQLGKPVGTDLRQKTPSLVNVIWKQSGDPFAVQFFNSPEISEEQCKRAVAHLKENPIIEQARSIATEYAEKALAELLALPESEIDLKVQKQLAAILTYSLERCN